jgi:hypothetical protein
MADETSKTSADEPTVPRVEVSQDGIRALNSEHVVVARFDFASVHADSGTRVAWTTETQWPTNDLGPRTCRHGKDAGQTCYPCDVQDGAQDT